MELLGKLGKNQFFHQSFVKLLSITTSIIFSESSLIRGKPSHKTA